MRIFILVFLVINLSLINNSSSIETCSRVAIINYQEVLVDANASQKGEGLRYHLEKDPVAKEFLETYQSNADIHWPNAALGTAGTILLLYGHGKSDTQLLITGAATILVNFLIARTLEVSNEANLDKAILEYNKRNLPKIFFKPEANRESYNNFPTIKIGLNQGWSF